MGKKKREKERKMKHSIHLEHPNEYKDFFLFSLSYLFFFSCADEDDEDEFGARGNENRKSKGGKMA